MRTPVLGMSDPGRQPDGKLQSGQTKPVGFSFGNGAPGSRCPNAIAVMRETPEEQKREKRNSKKMCSFIVFVLREQSRVRS